MELRNRPEVMEFLMSRRSRPAKTLTGPAPSHDALQVMLTAAARVPDHGKLEPWRFIVLEGVALQRLADLTAKIGAVRGEQPEKLSKAVMSFTAATQVIAVVTNTKPSEKIPQIEQHLSAGCVCLGLVNAALASGWGANWLSGWMAYDADWLAQGLDVAAPNFVAGFIHIGTEGAQPPERPRPDLATLTEWVSE